MPLPSSGQISFSQIRNTYGGTGEISLSDYYGAPDAFGDGVPSSGTISFSDFYGAGWRVIMSAVSGGSGGAYATATTSKEFIAQGGGGTGGIETEILYDTTLTDGEYIITVGAGGSSTVGADYNANANNNLGGGSSIGISGLNPIIDGADTVYSASLRSIGGQAYLDRKTDGTYSIQPVAALDDPNGKTNSGPNPGAYTQIYEYGSDNYFFALAGGGGEYQFNNHGSGSGDVSSLLTNDMFSKGGSGGTGSPSYIGNLGAGGGGSLIGYYSTVPDYQVYPSTSQTPAGGIGYYGAGQGAYVSAIGTRTNATSASPNSAGGGGGGIAWANNTAGPGGQGGSGKVVVVTTIAPTAVSGSYTYNNGTYTFTSSGSITFSRSQVLQAVA